MGFTSIRPNRVYAKPQLRSCLTVGATKLSAINTVTLNGAPFIHIGHGARAWLVLHWQICQIEAGQTDKFIDLPVQMTAPGHAPPGRSNPVLPALNAWFGREPVLDKAETAIRLEYPSHLAQRGQRIRNRTKCPRHHDGINGVVRKWDRGCRTQKKFDRYLCLSEFKLARTDDEVRREMA